MRLVLAAFVLSPFLAAQTQPAKPSNATGQCKDGTYSTASSKSGACRGHNGVKDWYTATSSTTVAAPATPTVAPTKAPTPTATVKPVPAPPAPTAAAAQPPAKPAAAKSPKANLATIPAAAGGAPNLVWVNTSSNVYHCYGHRLLRQDQSRLLHE